MKTLSHKCLVLLLAALLTVSFGGAAFALESAPQEAFDLQSLYALRKTPAGLVRHCEAQLGMPYWMGTFGQAPSVALLQQKAEQYPHDFPLSYQSKVLLNHMRFPRVYDCSGLIKSYWMQASPETPPVYDARYDLSAAGFYAVCAEKGESIFTMPPVPGTLVFILRRGRVVHMGVYAGLGWVIEARGQQCVMRTDLRYGGWTHWGVLPESWFS